AQPVQARPIQAGPRAPLVDEHVPGLEVVAVRLRPLPQRRDLTVNRLVPLLPARGHAGIDGRPPRPLPPPAPPWRRDPRPTPGAGAGLSAPPAAVRPGRRRIPTGSTTRGRVSPASPGTWP